MSRVHVPMHLPNRYYHVNAAKIARTNRILRLASVTFLGVMFWNLVWVLSNLNLTSGTQMVLTGLFVVATLMTFLYSLVHVINTWHYRAEQPQLFTGTNTPMVAVIIPTYNESIPIVSNTVKSVLLQDWPKDRMLVVVSDDGHRDDMQLAMENIQKFSGANILYYRPPKKGDPARNGDAKAGNLNAAVEYITGKYPYVQYIETRDADDLVANNNFLSHCIEYLESHPKTSFVQTIKQCRVSDGDPFSNQESVFYQRTMPAKFASNAVFPCGSGLVWRRSELERIGGFPGWNLVEDLQSGYEILRHGGEGAFLPIVGAMGQIAPEDIPNFYKQRGTWALDTLRLLYYRNPFRTKGLTFMQKLHFFELQFAYLLSFAMAVFILEIGIGLNTGTSPVLSHGSDNFVHLTLLAAALEAHTVARARGISYKDQWIARQTWLGLMPVFMISAVRALWYGPNKKPSYKVTRKYHKVGWYWHETFVQALIIVGLSVSVIRSLILPTAQPWLELGLQFWALFFVYGFSRVVINSWHRYRLPRPQPLQRRTANA